MALLARMFMGTCITMGCQPPAEVQNLLNLKKKCDKPSESCNGDMLVFARMIPM
jgi:hypothetical protein